MSPRCSAIARVSLAWVASPERHANGLQEWRRYPGSDPHEEASMFGLTAALTRSGHVVRALAAAGVIGAAACQDASRAVGPTKDVGEANALFLAAPQPDLIVKSFTYAPIDPNYPGYAWSTDVELTAVVSNAGLATAGASILSFTGWAPATLQPLAPVLSAPSPWLACTMPLRDGQFWVPALAPGSGLHRALDGPSPRRVLLPDHGDRQFAPVHLRMDPVEQFGARPFPGNRH